MASIAKKRREARLRRHRRVRKKVFGTTERPRLNVFRSLSNIYVQIIDDEKGHTLVSASTIELDAQEAIEGKNKSEAAKIIGKLVGERAVAAGVTEVVFDRGGYRYQGRVKALADGAREGGLKF
jgi:large subunit ribosomal protein L18